MSRSQLAKSRKAQKKNRRKKERDQRAQMLAGPKLSSKLAQRIDDALDLAAEGHLQQAKQMLAQIASRGTEYHQVVAAQLSVAQRLRDDEACSQLSRRLCEIRPREADAVLVHAESSMRCGRAAVAAKSFEAFLEKWPEHRNAADATKLLGVLREECERRIEQAGFPQSDGLRLQVMHEESLGYMRGHDFAKCEELCVELIQLAPSFCSARNNLALVQFHQGRLEDAIATAEETNRLFPENQFAQVAHAKLCFLSGNHDDANRLMDALTGEQPTHQDVFVAQCEILGMLGRDDDLLDLCNSVDMSVLEDPFSQAFRLHYAAYAHHRLGNFDAAQRYRDEYTEHGHKNRDAEENLIDLESGGGHAPWATAFAHWLPRAVLDQIRSQPQILQDPSHPVHTVLSRMVPALLDRGDPTGREFAVNFAKAVASEPLLESLQDFAYGQRGPDLMRSEALMFLNKRGHLGAGPHRIYSGGQWREIELLSAEIYWEPTESDETPEVRELYEEGHEAMLDQDYDHAEKCFDAVLEKDPTCVTARYNRCTVWMQRDGNSGMRKARSAIEKIHQDYPDYVFGRTAQVGYLLKDGKIDEAKELLVPVYHMKRLHWTEVRALYFAQAKICWHERDIASCERTIEMLEQIIGEDDPNIFQWRQRIAIHSTS